MEFIKRINWQDVLFPSALILISLALIGYYLNYEYLLTGYQDWIYHAFRVKSISEYGITSWDHKWANGINYWQTYQYFPHLLTLGLAKLLSISVAKAMIVWVVTIFIYMRVASYYVLRYARLPALASFLATHTSFLFVQQWGGIKDFSIFMALPLIPIFLLVWIKATKINKFYYIAAAIAGFAWSFHPTVGISLSSILFLDLLFNRRLEILPKLFITFLFLLAWSSFSSEHFLSGYKFAHPYQFTYSFVNSMLITENFGLSLLYLVLIGGLLMVLILGLDKLTYWAKVLLAYICLILVLFAIYRSQIVPEALNFLQLQRTNLIIGFIAPFVFVFLYRTICLRLKSKFLNFMILGLLAVSIVSAIEIGHIWGAIPTSKIQSDISNFFEGKDTSGSVHFENESELSYFSSSNVRLVSSYNEHLLPGPMSYLFKRLLRPNIGYIYITAEQISLIEDYMHVLGVEYLILPYNSPIVKKVKAGEVSFLEYESEIETENAVYSVVRNTRPIYYAYIVDEQGLKEDVGEGIIADPTLNIQSVRPWNELITKYAKFLQSKSVVPLQLEFVHPDTLKITMPKELPGMVKPILLVNQSYDKNWSADVSASIVPTNLRFMKLNLGGVKPSQVVTLTNKWPAWHWPVEALAPITVSISMLGVGAYSLFKKEKKDENKQI